MINYSHTLCVIESAFMHKQGTGNFIIVLLGIVTAVIHWNSLKIIKTLVRQIVCPAMYIVTVFTGLVNTTNPYIHRWG